MAIKQISLRNLPAKSRAKRWQAFKRETYFLATLQHPHLPLFYDCFCEQGNLFLVMQYIEGCTLQQYVEECGGSLPLEEVLDIGIQLCEVLEFLHRQNPPIIFRDLKPANVMRTPDGHIVLVDFGIARFFNEEQTGDTTTLGTPGYAPPEQYGLGQTDPRSDLYALGATLYFLLTGEVHAHPPRFLFPRLYWRSNAIGNQMGRLLLRLVVYDIRRRTVCAACVRAELEALAWEYQQGPCVSADTSDQQDALYGCRRSTHYHPQATTSASIARTVSDGERRTQRAPLPWWKLVWRAALILAVGLGLGILLAIVQIALR